MDSVPSIMVWPAAQPKARPQSPPPTPSRAIPESRSRPVTPPLAQGMSQRPEWICNPESPFFSPIELATPPASPDDFKTMTLPSLGMTTSNMILPSRFPLSGRPVSPIEHDIPSTDFRAVAALEAGLQRNSLHELKRNSITFMQRWLPARLIGEPSSAIAEKRKLVAQENRSNTPGMLKWRYKKVWRKRVMIMVMLAAMIYHCYGIFSGIDLAQARASWMTSSLDDNYTPKSFRSTMRRSTQPTGGAVIKSMGSPRSVRPKAVATSGHVIDHGILAVDTSLPVSSHPILQLTRDARTAWDAKVSGQSKTLKAAVAEYKKRNRGRNPPKGFDQWWSLVRENNVQLPDEYDQINDDLALFRALSPTELNTRIADAMEYDDTFHLIVQDGSISVGGTFSDDMIEGATDRMSGQVELLEEFNITGWLPDLRAVFGVHDTPLGFIGADHRSDLLNAVDDDEYYDPTEELDVSVRGWSAGCPPNSKLRRLEQGLEVAPRPAKSFVSDITGNTDLCAHPHIVNMHGITAGKAPNVAGRLEAMFSLSKTSLHTDVLAVPVEQWMESLPSIEWSQRNNSKLMWRGSNTGVYHSAQTPWRDSHRTRLVRDTSKYIDSEIEILPSPGTMGDAAKTTSMKDATLHYRSGSANARLFDISFAGQPIQCEISDGTCRELAEDYDFKSNLMTFEDALEYKYVLDIDGNSWSARTQRLLLGGSLMFKSSINPEWWSDRIQPWVHYVPINIDYSDLHDAFAFFHGDLAGRGGNPELAERMAKDGQDWVRTHWRRVDMAAYMSRLYLEWARLVAPHRQSMDFVYHESMEI